MVLIAVLALLVVSSAKLISTISSET